MGFYFENRISHLKTESGVPLFTWKCSFHCLSTDCNTNLCLKGSKEEKYETLLREILFNQTFRLF